MGTKKIAEFINGTSYKDIPDEVVAVAKKYILDCLGVMLAGSRESTGRIMVEHVKELGGGT
ncbi:MmgE/PrpD family protein [Chloroflexota bacterium]